VPTQKDIQQFAEFNNIFIHNVDARVEMLIGNDRNRHILQPHEVINSSRDHYATKTIVGWVINCPKRCNKALIHSKSFFAKPKLQTGSLICSLCMDMVKTLVGNHFEISREQTRFMDLVSDSIHHCKNQHFKIALPLHNRNLNVPYSKSMAEPVNEVETAKNLILRYSQQLAFYQEMESLKQDRTIKRQAIFLS